MNLKQLKVAISEVSKERNISEDELIDLIKVALEKGFKREAKSLVEVILDPKTFDMEIFTVKYVVDTYEDVEISDSERIDETYILTSEAPEGSKDGDVLREKLEISLEDLSRVAASTAKQVIMQKLRELEREQLAELYESKKHQLVRGVVTGVTEQKVFVDFDEIEATMPSLEWIQGEEYKLGDKINVYVKDVKIYPKGPSLLLSRKDEGLLRELLKKEVPEIADGTVEIMGLKREPGQRAKVAVRSHNPNIEAIGACVGQDGARQKTVSESICNEEVEFILYDEEYPQFIVNALAPAKVLAIIPNEDDREAMVVVANESFSLAIGLRGVNARLASRLTEWKVDIKSVDQSREIGIDYEDFAI